MGIEIGYYYKYYTVIDIEKWRRGNEHIWGDEGFTWKVAVEFINYKFKNSDDKSVNNYRVDNAGYEVDIEDWIRILKNSKECPIFVKFQYDQPIKTMGEGSLFVLYEEDDDCEGTNSGYTSNFAWSRASDANNVISPDSSYWNRLACEGGRL
jgi:hypothetical protein